MKYKPEIPPCPKCRGKTRKAGHDGNKTQRYLCPSCGVTFLAKYNNGPGWPSGENHYKRLPNSLRATVIRDYEADKTYGCKSRLARKHKVSVMTICRIIKERASINQTVGDLAHER